MTATADFKPSQVFLSSGPPLGATMRKTEREAAAAYIVRTCQAHGDIWQPVSDSMLRTTLREDMAADREPFISWIRNPFLKPDFPGLVDDGFPQYIDQEGLSSIEFTQAGLDALKPYVRRQSSVPQNA